MVCVYYIDLFVGIIYANVHLTVWQIQFFFPLHLLRICHVHNNKMKCARARECVLTLSISIICSHHNHLLLVIFHFSSGNRVSLNDDNNRIIQ